MRGVAMVRVTACSVALASVLLAGGAVAQGPEQPGTTGRSTEGGKDGRSMSDPEFLNRAILSDHSAINAAKLAMQRGGSGEVKQVAQTVVSSHTEMLNQLKQVAQTMGWKYDDTAGTMGRQMCRRLQGMSGAAFDKAFIDDMVKLHQRERALYEAESANAHNEPLMKIAGDQLPTIRQHLQDLEGIQKNGPKG